MKTQELFNKDGIPVYAFLCGVCGAVHRSTSQSDNCCSGNTNSDVIYCKCGRSKIYKIQGKCELCSEEETFAKAEKVESWVGYIYDPIHDIFYASLDEMKEEYLSKLEILPKYVYICDEVRPFSCPDLADYLGWVDQDNETEEISSSCKGIKELEDAIDAFKAKNKGLCNHLANFSKVLVIE